MKKSVTFPTASSEMFPQSDNGYHFPGADHCIGRTILLRPEEMFNPFENYVAYFTWAFKRCYSAGFERIIDTVPESMQNGMNSWFVEVNLPWTIKNNALTPRANSVDAPCAYEWSEVTGLTSSLLKERHAFCQKNVAEDSAETTVMLLNDEIFLAMYNGPLPRWSIYSRTADMLRKHWEEVAPVVEAAGWLLKIDQHFMYLIKK